MPNFSIFKRLAIGTANWGKPYGLSNVQVPESECLKILDECQRVGIDTLHSSKEYACNEFLVEHAKRFRIVWKEDIFTIYQEPGMIASYLPIICVPYSVFDRRFEPYFPEWHTKNLIYVRSIFLQGAVFLKDIPDYLRPIAPIIRRLQMTIGSGLFCLLFVLMNPYVNKVILGVDSAEQLRQYTVWLEKFDQYVCDDINILDPRRWPKQT